MARKESQLPAIARADISAADAVRMLEADYLGGRPRSVSLPVDEALGALADHAPLSVLEELAALLSPYLSGRRVVYAEDYAGADLGAQINAALADLGADPGTVAVVEPGQITTQVRFTANHALAVYDAIANNCPDSPTIIAESRVRFVGMTGRASIAETSIDVANVGAIIHPSSLVDGARDGTNEDIVIEGLKFPGHAGRVNASVTSAVSLGNCVRGRIRHCEFDGLHNLVVGIGANPFSGNCGNDCWIEFCTFTRFGICAYVVNARNSGIRWNTFRLPGMPDVGGSAAPIDVEPNDPLDVAENLYVVGNVIDLRGGSVADGSVFAVSIQKSALVRTGRIYVTDNVVVGGDLEAGTGTKLGGGVGVNGCNEVLVARNVVHRAGQYAVALNYSARCAVTDNEFVQSGADHIGCVYVSGRDNRVARNAAVAVAGLALSSRERALEYDFEFTVNTDGTAVTSTSGGHFADWMVGQPVRVNGVANVVAAVADCNVATLEASAGTQTGATLAVLTSDNRFDVETPPGQAPASAVVLRRSSKVYADYRPEPPASWGVVAHWPLNGEPGDAEDFGPNGLTLTDVNTVGSAPGLVTPDAALLTRANSESYTRASEALLQTGDVDFWWAGWVWVNGTANYQEIVAKFAGGDHEFRLLFWQATGKLRWEAWGSGSAVESVADLTAGAWHFFFAYALAAGGAGGMGLRLDGAAAVTGTPGAAAATAAALQMGVSASAESLDGRLNAVTFGKAAAGSLTSARRDEIHDRLYNAGAGLAYPF